ncbi:hypothetical protein DOTSEDRAFT_28034 [Dothistroma septosporum NZE10]|uniref:Uncharacterized protein n=1 Tax=Dothistroma septosporum (strain NZE10 / CBS 128990) TaxID=675120 RepID=N1PDE2_DOTSN|nr:hypothetical protein DOTSEDRAFT_28034 [Dothistroma septosporum NZE10]
MATSLFNRLFQSTAQPSSLGQVARAATPSDDEPEFEAIEIGVERIERPVWLTSLFKYEDGHYHYAVGFAGYAEDNDGRRHDYDKYSGIIAVPEDRVKPRIKELFHRHNKIDIPQSNESRCEASLSKIVDVDDNGEDEQCFVRQLRVNHGQTRSQYTGQCWIPCSEETPTRWAYEAKFAVPSVESVPDEPEPKRNVVFMGVPHERKKVRVEVWSIDGHSSYRGTADVHDIRRRIDGEVQRVCLIIRAPVAHHSYVWLQGDYAENGSTRYGPFAEINEPEG